VAALLTSKEHRFSLDRRMRGPHSRSGRGDKKKIPTLAGIEHRSSSP